MVNSADPDIKQEKTAQHETVVETALFAEEQPPLAINRSLYTSIEMEVQDVSPIDSHVEASDGIWKQSSV